MQLMYMSIKLKEGRLKMLFMISLKELYDFIIIINSRTANQLFANCQFIGKNKKLAILIRILLKIQYRFFLSINWKLAPSNINLHKIGKKNFYKNFSLKNDFFWQFAINCKKIGNFV